MERAKIIKSPFSKNFVLFLLVILANIFLYFIQEDFYQIQIMIEFSFTIALIYFAYMQSKYTSLQYRILKKSTEPIIYVSSKNNNEIIIENASNFPIFKVIVFGQEFHTKEKEYFYDMIEIIHPQQNVVLETPVIWREKMAINLTISYCTGGPREERKSWSEIVFLDTQGYPHAENLQFEIEDYQELETK